MLQLPDSDSQLTAAAIVLADSGVSGAIRLVAQQLTLATPWRNSPSTSLQVLYRVSANSLQAILSTEPLAATEAGFEKLQEQALDLLAPVELVPVHIHKPWGQEIWYSGIEQRGESMVRQGKVELPLSHYLALAPQRLCQRRQPILLKTLDPLADAPAGDLYYETHDKKHEIYVVTQIDAAAWPEAVGAIRFGMNQAVRKKYACDADFRTAYLGAVRDYEALRREIDTFNLQPDSHPDVTGKLQERETALREAMEQFTALLPLRLGDVVQVPPGVPHSLQHGVRVIEFQTPTFERNIISFGQRVLTQDNWDSDYAIANMSLDAPAGPDLVSLKQDSSHSVERIVDFDEFEVLRVRLGPGAIYSLTEPSSDDRAYTLVAAISGEFSVTQTGGALPLAAGSLPLAAGAALFVPGCCPAANLLNAGTEDAWACIATPKPIPTKSQKGTHRE